MLSLFRFAQRTVSHTPFPRALPSRIPAPLPISFPSSSAVDVINQAISRFAGPVRYFAYRPKQEPIKQWKIFRGDKVQVLSGKDAGKQGFVLKVFRKKNAVRVQGVNMVKKAIRATDQTEGGWIRKFMPVHVSTVALIDPEKKVPTRIAWRFLKSGTRVRISKKSGALIRKPKRRPVQLQVKTGLKDTVPDKVLERTYLAPEIIPKIQQRMAMRK
eukprot:GILK01002658.1.p1 GENE.GILK01002658.1~~GILK01002658.1.p1  ORF type:complete len:215 (-),score=14.06 GILK01002658.1:99-743(-)